LTVDSGTDSTPWRTTLRHGVVIPAHPLALTDAKRLDERRQRALTRYYVAAGAGGIAVGVHTTQFAIRRRDVGLYQPVLELAAAALDERGMHRESPFVRVAGICGDTAQAVGEASVAAALGYHVGLVSLAGMERATDDTLLDHLRQVGQVIPVMGFYLQPAVGGRVLSSAFWHRAVEIETLVAIKIAPFDRYRTLDVIRAVADSGRHDDLALYTGNDDHIVLDLLTAFQLAADMPVLHIVGGLLGQWAVWTTRAVETHAECRALVRSRSAVPAELLTRAAQITDANAAIFDAAHGFAGVIPGIHEVLRRQGMLCGTWCLDDGERLAPAQAESITRAIDRYPHLTDDDFVTAHLDEWMR